MGTTIVSFHITFEMEGYKITYVWDKMHEDANALGSQRLGGDGFHL